MRLFMSTATKQTATANAAETETASGIALSSDWGDSLPVSFAQQRLWFLDQLEPDSPLYNLSTVARITGNLDETVLQRAINAIVARHEILRTRIVSREEIPSQVISENISVPLERLDVSQWKDAEGKARQIIGEETNRPFNLSAAPLLRPLLLRLRDEEHLLIITMHHIISDEWSVKIFFRELAEFYCAFVESRPAQLAELPIQYADYAVWQQEGLHNER